MRGLDGKLDMERKKLILETCLGMKRATGASIVSIVVGVVRKTAAAHLHLRGFVFSNFGADSSNFLR